MEQISLFSAELNSNLIDVTPKNMIIYDSSGIPMDLVRIRNQMERYSNNQYNLLDYLEVLLGRRVKLTQYYDEEGEFIGREPLLVYIVQGKAFGLSLKYDFVRYQGRSHSYVTIGEWRKAPKIEPYITFIQPENELRQCLAKDNPYAVATFDELGISCGYYYLAPQLEILKKAGYVFVDSLVNALHNRYGSSTITEFNRLTKPGKNPKEIFKTEKPVYVTLKNESNLETWDVYRKLYKQGKINKDTINSLYHAGIQTRELELISRILAHEYCGKKVFTLEKLLRYLRRIDQYEAIGQSEGLQLLADYLSSCKLLEMKPCVDGDSLKREHDVTARLCRQHRNEIVSKRMVESYEKNKKYNYEEGVFFVRAIESYDDLIDEATQQHNCVACYSDAIARGTSIIMVLREKKHPQKSLVTIELSPNGKEIRQKFLAYNQPIRNKSISDFIDRWTKEIKNR